MRAPAGKLLSVNVAEVREIELGGKRVETGIYKLPLSGRVAVRDHQLAGDRQVNLNAHGGPEKAVYAYASEDYGWWSAELGRELAPGEFGDNLTTAGIDVSGALVGERWRIGTTLLEVCQPRQPCAKLGYKMGDQRFVKRFARALRPGAYLRVIDEGELGAGDAIEVVERPAHEVSVALMAGVVIGEVAAERALAAPALPAEWRAWAERRAAA